MSTLVRFAAIGFAAAALAGCAAGASLPPPTMAQADQYIGQKRWISPTSPIYVWDGPPKQGEIFGQGTGMPTKSGVFTVEEATHGLRNGYWIKFDNGRRGWTHDSLILTDSASEHASKLAEKAACDLKGGVAVGMSREQVYASCWGKPQKINLTRTGNGDSEQLVYPGYNYVYLRNGLVTSIQTSQ
jgi:hypothetical protein